VASAPPLPAAETEPLTRPLLAPSASAAALALAAVFAVPA
jgi:hypothetical protein